MPVYLRYFASICTVIITLLYSLSGYTADEATAERWYTVEIIIFGHMQEYRYDQELQSLYLNDFSPIENAVELKPYILPMSVETSDEMTSADDGVSPSNVNEIASTTLALPQESSAISPTLPIVETASGNIPQPEFAWPEPFSIPDPDSFLLTEKAAKIEQSQKLKLLLHVAWQQPGLDHDNAIPVHISNIIQTKILAHPENESVLPKQSDRQQDIEADKALPVVISDGIPLVDDSTTNSETTQSQPSYFDQYYISNNNEISELPEQLVNGTITVKLSRYLHMEFDLEYRDSDVAPDENTKTPVSPVRLTNSDHIELYHSENEMGNTSTLERNKPQVFKLQHSRKMRSKELHYIDHPRIGVLALITPLEQPVVPTPDKPVE